MAKKTSIFLLVATAALSTPAAAQRSTNWNPSLDSVNQPVVQRTDYVFDLQGGGRVSDSELRRLAHWFDSLDLGYGDRVSVDTGSYDDQQARQAIAGVVADHGLLLSRGVPMTAGAVQPGFVRVIVSRSHAFVPGCPNWEEAYEVGNRNTTGSNFGCSINSNIAAMIADPNDLILGQSGARGGDAASTSKAVAEYRSRALSGAGGQVKAESAGGK